MFSIQPDLKLQVGKLLSNEMQITQKTLFRFVASTMSFCLYEIAKNADIQQKVHEEIDEVLAKYNGQLTYDAINELKYLDCCIDGMLINLISHSIHFDI